MSYFTNLILPLALNKVFIYSVTAEEYHKLQPGIRVIAPFGKDKQYTALVLDKTTNAPNLPYEIKPIDAILDDQPIVPEVQLKLWQWMAKYYICPPGIIFKAALPSGFLVDSTSYFYISKEATPSTALSKEAQTVYRLIFEASNLGFADLVQKTGVKTTTQGVEELLQKKLIRRELEVFEKYKPKFIKHLRVAEATLQPDQLKKTLESLENAPKQKALFMRLITLPRSRSSDGITLEQIKQIDGFSVSALKALVDKELIEQFEIQKDRISITKEKQKGILDDATNNKSKTTAKHILERPITVFHAHSDAGKFEVYIELIKTCFRRQKNVLFLCPEVRLLDAIQNKLSTGLDAADILQLSSNLNTQEQIEVWNKLLINENKAGETKPILALGIRSAVFVPLKNIGLIIVDDEHDRAYKQRQSSPMYSGKDVAIYLSTLHKEAQVVLGSFSPSVDSIHFIKKERYGYVAALPEGADEKSPIIELIDLKDAYKRKRVTELFSYQLIEAMQACFDLGKQVVLFQNRRGFAPVLFCETCGFVAECPQCDVSLNAHLQSNSLKCHYCGYSVRLPKKCPKCQSHSVEYKGFGTEQIEQSFMNVFPKQKILRIDYDSTKSRHALQKKLELFYQKQLDAIVGTQMIAKGIDYKNVGLVGVINADQMLYHQHFRAAEHSFQLMMQFAESLHIRKEPPKIMIQAYNTSHSAYQAITTYDFNAFYEKELSQRASFNYPPTSKIIEITLKNRDYNAVKNGAEWMTEKLRAAFGKSRVLGPAVPAIAKIKNQYLFTILLKLNLKKDISAQKKYIQDSVDAFQSVAQFRKISLQIEVDA
ncbi:MAG: primosomal protein N' [Flavobacteriaceae bacterium]|nr:primosomal protein N' [Flavobacteriaceae bacterium]